MIEPQNALSDILGLTGIFRLEKGCWPLHAAQLQGFALGFNRSLDFRSFQKFRFEPKGTGELVVEILITTPGSEWSRRCQARILLMNDNRSSKIPCFTRSRFKPFLPRRWNPKVIA